MFRVENNVPEVYPSESRDFQLFARLYDLVFQSSRYSIDSLSRVSTTEKCNERLLSLLSTKLGFFSSQSISDKTARHILSVFPYIIKYKGSMRGLELIVNVFEKVANTSISIIKSEFDDDSDLTIRFYRYDSDIELLKELIEYVRPTGFRISFITTSNTKSESDFRQTDTIRVVHMKPYKSSITRELSGYDNTVGNTQVVTKQEPQ